MTKSPIVIENCVISCIFIKITPFKAVKYMNVSHSDSKSARSCRGTKYRRRFWKDMGEKRLCEYHMRLLI